MLKQRPNYGSYSEQIQKILKEKNPELYAKQQKKKAAWKKWHGSEAQRKAAGNFATNVATVATLPMGGGPAMTWLLNLGLKGRKIYNAWKAAKAANNTKKMTQIQKQANNLKNKTNKVTNNKVSNQKNTKVSNQKNTNASGASKNNKSKIAPTKGKTVYKPGTVGPNRPVKGNPKGKPRNPKPTDPKKGQVWNGKTWNGVAWVAAGATPLVGLSIADKLMGNQGSGNEVKKSSKIIPKKKKESSGNPGKGNQVKAQGNKKGGSGGMDTGKTKKSANTTKAKTPKYTGKFIDKKGDVAYDSIGSFFKHMTGKQTEKAAPKDMKQVKAATKGATKGISYSKQKSNTKKKQKSNITNAAGGTHVKASRYYSGGGHIFTGR